MTTRALVFTDLVDSTQLVERLGDARAAELWAAHDCAARELIAACGGREIDRTDGFFAIFEHAADAARFALAYQRDAAGLGLAARVGIHVGAVVLRANSAAEVERGAKPVEVEGIAKPFAARVMALAAGGQTLVSGSARDALVAAAELPDGAELESHGHYRLKGVEAPAELFELGVRGVAAFAPPADGEKAYRVVADGPGLWRPLREVRHNLAAERDAFVGRACELRALAQRLDAGARLLTVVGPGGTGKTRLVTRYARGWLGDWPGGVVFCDLSDARTADGIHHAVALALGVPLLAGDAAAQLGHAIAARGRCLVVLDNFEQVVAHAPATLGRWLDRAAQAAFVVTSRERLQLAGEEVFGVEPLALAGDAIELFVVRARAQRPGFEIAADERAAVGEIVRLLDGLPLAIELAAARVRVLSPRQIVARLQDRFALLAGARGAAARQATLAAAIDWSWALLAPWEQAALAQCSVFQGGFTLEAAERVIDLSAWPQAGPVLDTVQALLDKSLLRTWSVDGPQRQAIAEPFFGMYLSIHEYAAARLEALAGGAAQAARLRHARHFAAHGSDAALDALGGPDGVLRQRLLALELDNLVVACRRAVEQGEGGLALDCLRAAWSVLDLRGPFAVGEGLAIQVLGCAGLDAAQRAAALLLRVRSVRRQGRPGEVEAWLIEALRLAEAAADARVRAEALTEFGHLCDDLGRDDESGAAFEAALDLQRARDAPVKVAMLMANLGNHHLFRGDAETARGWYEGALAAQRALGNRRGEARLLAGMAVLHHDTGEMARARELYETAIDALRETGDRMTEGIVLGNLATLHNDLGELARAEAAYDAAIAIARELGDRNGEAVTLGNLGKLRRDLGRGDEARAAYEASLAIARDSGHKRTEGIALEGLGCCHVDAGRLEPALAAYDAALALHRSIGNRRFEGQCLANRGEVLAGLGRVDEARAEIAQGEAVLREIGDALGLAKLLCVRGAVEAQHGAHDAARAALDEAVAIAATLGAQAQSELGQSIEALRARLA